MEEDAERDHEEVGNMIDGDKVDNVNWQDTGVTDLQQL